MGQAEIQVDIIVPNQTRYLSLIRRIGEGIARELDRHTGDREALAYNLNLVLTEAMVNAIEYASPGDKTVQITIHTAHDDLCIKVYDQGQGFDLDAIPLPDLDNPTERGRGIFFIKTLMDSVSYRKTEDGNVLEMRKKLTST
jgi:serine/threonine-protein kinase RsbW